jgi:hypothetical protein
MLYVPADLNGDRRGNSSEEVSGSIMTVPASDSIENSTELYSERL